MEIDKEIKKLIKVCEEQGFKIGSRKNGHPVVYDPDGTHIVDLPSTPSDRRSLRNALAPLRRAGLVWPPTK